MIGANKRVIDSKMPHLASLLCPDLKTALGSKCFQGGAGSACVLLVRAGTEVKAGEDDGQR